MDKHDIPWINPPFQQPRLDLPDLDANPLFRRVCLSTGCIIARIYGLYNGIHVVGGEKMVKYVDGRKPGQPLITLMNHVSTVDDAYLMCNLLPFSSVTHPQASRWAWCAQEICFKNKLFGSIAYAGKGLPIVRGMGLHQQGMELAGQLLRRGQWLNVFPEGRCFQGTGVNLLPFRWGVGKLVDDVKRLDPLIVPIVHRGMERIMPLSTVVPRLGHKVHVMVGDPLPVKEVLDLWQKRVENNPGWGDPWPPHREELYEMLTSHMRDAMLKLQAELDREILREAQQTELPPSPSSSRLQ